ncbi:MAG: exodeoxyribonuclease VII large subunit [Thermodesulfobacteriaceae bacterium]|nr:exodeoxyribonuclease VII large subunit [Thermodesulfobacteriaceae bacterium]
MLELFPSFAEEKENKLFYTVKEITQSIKDLMEKSYPLLWIEGEIANLRYSQNGNVYFNLIEEEASLKAIIFNSQRDSKIVPYLRNGLKVICLSKLTFFSRSGECFLVIRKIEPLGTGALILKKEALIEKYKSLFDPSRKRALPKYPKKIALITSLFGAALQDFLKIAQDKWEVEILVYPVKVQGEGAEKEIVQAVYEINLKFPEVEIIVITRGGGSFEDLAPFYSEDIILGLKDSKIPIVSAVGHEIDYTLCDLIADKRCPTPSAAAQEILPDKTEILKKLTFYRERLSKQTELLFSKWERLVHQFKWRLQKRSPQEKLISWEENLKAFKKHLQINLEKLLFQKEKKLENFKNLLFSLSPLNILQKGYSIVKSYPEGKIVKSVKEVREKEYLEIQLAEGKLLVKVEKILR